MSASGSVGGTVKLQVEQGIEGRISTEVDITTATTISAVGPTMWFVFLPKKSDASVPAIALVMVSSYCINSNYLRLVI